MTVSDLVLLRWGRSAGQEEEQDLGIDSTYSGQMEQCRAWPIIRLRMSPSLVTHHSLRTYAAMSSTLCCMLCAACYTLQQLE